MCESQYSTMPVPGLDGGGRFFPFFYSSTWPSYLTDLLSLRLVEGVGARNYVRSSVSKWVLGIQLSLKNGIF